MPTDPQQELQYAINRLSQELVDTGEARGKLLAQLDALQQRQYAITRELKKLIDTPTTTKE